ncbi:hypothetical protein G7A66_03185 [Altererythrobacter sp. SALINAS58]|uniref:hypothetical protein n=1 Tax=Alteripontixanthobacter muriae TaxID=2705546 RepID=UPI00157742FF|nr:hypothetical protein [Alteripontixanthobacter muriae]NTZ42113.1 hypothetical protein [Alteripontixanthobacter muriae]
MRFALIIPCFLIASLAAAERPSSANIASGRIADDRMFSRKDLTPVASPDPSIADEMETNDCRGQIHTIRQERELHSLEGESDAKEPYAIKAIDQRIDGCSVMVMHHDINDVRPLPDVQANPVGLIPLR